MKPESSFTTAFWRIFRLLGLIVVLASCEFDPVLHLEPKVWIDSPAEGSRIMEGTQVSVSAVVRMRWGTLDDFYLSVEKPDGATFQVPLTRSMPGDTGIVRGTYEWIPDLPGRYTLVVYARAGDTTVVSEPVHFTVTTIQAHRGLSTTPTATASPTVPVTSSPLPSATPSPSVTPSPIPSATATLIPTATLPPPSPTRDTIPPQVDQVRASEEQIAWPECEPASVTITARVTDPSGIAGVHLLYRVVRGDGQTGAWLNKTMALQDASQHLYSTTLYASELPQSLNPPVTASASTKAYVEYFVVATDNPPGQPMNTGQAPSGGQGYRLPILLCTVPR